MHIFQQLWMVQGKVPREVSANAAAVAQSAALLAAHQLLPGGWGAGAAVVTLVQTEPLQPAQQRLVRRRPGGEGYRAPSRFLQRTQAQTRFGLFEQVHTGRLPVPAQTASASKRLILPW